MQRENETIKGVVVLLIVCFLSVHISFSQNNFFTPSDSLNKKRLIGVSSGITVAYAGSMIGLGQLWYANQPKSNFSFYNDNRDWLQMDKFGHAYSAYWIQNRVHAMLRWSGMKRNNALIISGVYSFVFQGTFEILDGFSPNYGFSYGDVIANTSGVVLYTGQELLFKKQILTPKFSFFPSKYAAYRPEVLGSNFAEQLLKDYNAQTYWLSLNLSDVTPASWKIPEWICLSFGYSIGEKLKGDQEYYVLQDGNETQAFSSYRRYMFSLDVDLSRIPVKKPWLKTLLSTLNTLKMPFPALELSNRGTKGYWMYY